MAEAPNVQLILLVKVITPANRIFFNLLSVSKSVSIEIDNGKYANFFVVDRLSKMGIEFLLSDYDFISIAKFLNEIPKFILYLGILRDKPVVAVNNIDDILLILL